MEEDKRYWEGFMEGLTWVLNNMAIPWNIHLSIRLKQGEVLNNKLGYEDQVRKTESDPSSSFFRNDSVIQ